MEQATPINKFQENRASSRKDKTFFKKPDRNETKAENKDKSFPPLDRETLIDLRKKKIYFYYKGPYST